MKNEIMKKLDKYMSEKVKEIEFYKNEIEAIKNNFKKQVKEEKMERLSISVYMKKVEDNQSSINAFKEKIELNKEEIEYMNHLSTAPEEMYEIELGTINYRLDELKYALKSNLTSQRKILKGDYEFNVIKSMIEGLKQGMKNLSYEQATLLRKKEILYKVIS